MTEPPHAPIYLFFFLKECKHNKFIYTCQKCRSYVSSPRDFALVGLGLDQNLWIRRAPEVTDFQYHLLQGEGDINRVTIRYTTRQLQGPSSQRKTERNGEKTGFPSSGGKKYSNTPVADTGRKVWISSRLVKEGSAKTMTAPRTLWKNRDWAGGWRITLKLHLSVKHCIY